MQKSQSSSNSIGHQKNTRRIIHHANALEWLTQPHDFSGCSFVTSMPDYSEFSSHMTLTEWKNWFTRAAALVLSRCPDDGVTIFFQSDIKHEGTWVDKSYLCQKAAEQTSHELIAHKIICRAPAGITTFGRPSYSHLICFSKKARLDTKKSSMDVLPAAGKVTWTRGMGIEACKLACRIIKDLTTSHTVVDPFCGHGSVLMVANSLGFNSIGVELSRKRAEKAEKLTMDDLL